MYLKVIGTLKQARAVFALSSRTYIFRKTDSRYDAVIVEIPWRESGNEVEVQIAERVSEN